MNAYTFVNDATGIPVAHFYAALSQDAEINCPADCSVVPGLLPIAAFQLDPWIEVREIRDARLVGSDWTQLPDVPLSTKEAWAAYRQQLRDITNQPDPLNIVWPTPP
jgi:hypothetical protein